MEHFKVGDVLECITRSVATGWDIDGCKLQITKVREEENKEEDGDYGLYNLTKDKFFAYVGMRFVEWNFQKCG